MNPLVPTVLLMADPFSWTAFFIALAASAAATGASMLAAHLFAPKKKPMIRGKLSGDLYVQNAEPGAVIKKIYGGDLGDGLGFGVLTAGEVLWMSKVRKVVSTTRESSGGKMGGGGGAQEVQNVNYYVDVAIMFGWGPLDFWEVRANSEVIYAIDPEAAGSIHEAEDGQLASLAVPFDSAGASNGRAVSLTKVLIAEGSITWDLSTVFGGMNTLRLFYAAATATSVRYQIAGGAFVLVPLPATGGAEIYKHIDLDMVLAAGSNTFTLKAAQNEAANIDYLRTIPHNPTRTGMLDNTVLPDPDYTQDTLFDARLEYERNVDRWNHLPPPDEFGVRGGTINAGNYAGLVFYPGNMEQLPDPTMQNDLDAKHGEGSTPAHKRKGYMVANNFSITKFGGTIPLFLARVSHQIIKNARQMMEAECKQSGLQPADVNFAGFEQHRLRGVFSTQIQSARSLHDATVARIFNTKLVDTDGQIVGVTLGQTGDPIIVDENDLGVVDEGRAPAEDNSPLRRVDVTYATDIEAAKTTNLTYFDPAKKYERSNVSFDLLDVDTERVEQVEIPATLTADEAQAITIRSAYQQYLESTEGYNLNLPYKYAKAHPTKTLIVTDEGVTFKMRLVSREAAPGSLITLTGVPEDVATFAQVLRGSDIVGDVPLVPIPAMTMGVLIDSMLLRDGDESINNGVGFYVAACKRTGAGAWPGWALLRYRSEWESVASSNLPATIGTAASVLPAGQTFVFDDHPSANENNYVDIDLYDTGALESASAEAVLGGANVALLGSEIIQFKHAERRPLEEGANRWRLYGLLRGRRRTESEVDDHQLGERFLLINIAVIFVAIAIADLNVERDYKFLTTGATTSQSVSDAPTVKWAWTGGSKRSPAPTVTGVRDPSTLDWHVDIRSRSRLGDSLVDFGQNPTGERVEEFFIELLDSTRTQIKRKFGPVRPNKLKYRPVRLTAATWPGNFAIAPDDPYVALIEGNNLSNVDQGGIYSRENETAKAYADEVINSGMDIAVSAVLDLTNHGSASLALNRAALAPNAEGVEYVLGVGGVNQTTLTILARLPNGVFAQVYNDPLGHMQTTRYEIVVEHDQVSFYRYGQPTPLYTAASLPAYPLVPYFEAGARGRVREIFMTNYDSRATFILTEEQQVQILGAAANPLELIVYQNSEYVGRGYDAEVTLHA